MSAIPGNEEQSDNLMSPDIHSDGIYSVESDAYLHAAQTISVISSYNTRGGFYPCTTHD
jgi:hypothetical protein